MNDYDRNNLKFVMNASPEVLKDWFKKLPEDDILYAVELIQQAAIELELKELERYDNIENIDLAKSYLSKFKL